MEVLLLILAILVPYGVLAAIYYYGFRGLIRAHLRNKNLFLPPLIITFLLTAGLIIKTFHDIAISTSSTAAIGFLFLPYAALLSAVLGFILSLALWYCIRFAAERIGLFKTRITSPSKFIWALLFLVVVGWGVHHTIQRDRLLDAATEMADTATLQSLLNRALKFRDWELLSNLAKNPHMPVPDLIRMYEDCKKDAEAPSTSESPTFSLAQNPNTPKQPESSVFHSLAQNPNTPADILTALAKSPLGFVRLQVASNPSTPVEVLKGLVDDEYSLLRSYLSENPNLPEPLRQQLQADDSKQEETPSKALTASP